jgi:DNA helicase-2/ATP-dependent DNA helicase PcrA
MSITVPHIVGVPGLSRYPHEETTMSKYDRNGITYSSQQNDLFEWVVNGSGSAVLVAVAGAGKSTAIRRGVALCKGSVAVVAYNKKIADHMSAGLAADGCGRNVQARTFHAFGFYAWRRVAPDVKLDEKKVLNIMVAAKVPDALMSFVGKLVSLAKNHAIGVVKPFDDMQAWWHLVHHYDLDQDLPDETVDGNDPVELGISLARQTLRTSTSMDREVIDYDDMIYAPLFHNAKVWQNNWVWVDESQDINPARRAYAKKMLAPGGRAVFVGDPCQAIYGFTGAENDALDIIQKEFGAVRMPLTVTYRCPKAVVSHAQNWVSHITAAPTAPQGEVVGMLDTEFVKQFANLGPQDAILCRNTKPLVALAYTLIRNKVACHVEGRDIGKGLLVLAGKWRVKYVRTLVDKLDAHLAKQTEKFLAKGQEQKAEALADKVDTLKTIIESLPEDATLASLKQEVEGLFGDTPDGETPKNLTLSTVHKAKGREWGTVYLWGRNKLMPSKYARQAWQMDQENNLVYVAVTRAMNRLVEVMVTI